MGLLHHKFRPPHLGRYAMETVRRVAKPTTRIDSDRVPRVPLRGAFFTRPMFGDMGERVREERARFINKYPLAAAMEDIVQTLVPLQDGDTAPEQAPGTDDPEAMARHLKALCYFMKVDIVGICEIPEYAWYSHDGEGKPVAADHKYAIVLVFDQGYETMEGASGDDWISGTQSYRAYLEGQVTGSVVANYIRRLGYDARCHSARKGQLQQIPLMLLAGLGELSRIGELVLNPFIGPRSKTAVISTNLPLAVDQPIDFGLQAFCEKCYKCARECPCQAIPYGDKILFNGYEIWKPDVETCAKYRITNQKGSACGRCMKTCPLNKLMTPDAPLLLRLAKWCGIHAWSLKPLLNRIAIWLDDRLGHGRRVPGQKWWLDLEYRDGRLVHPPAGANEREISPDKPNPTNQRVAIYPAEDNPPGDCREAHPIDRKAAVAKGVAAQERGVPQ